MVKSASLFGRYLLWQVPGWMVGGLVLALIVWTFDLPRWIVAAGVAVLAARDLILYPAMRAALRPPAPSRPIGARGVSVKALRPSGLIRVRGELWRAEAVGDDIPEGREVIVRGARGLTLLVEPADGGSR